jgi:ATP:corrinoid adenosyltransferase
MKIKDLKKLIRHIPDDVEVVLGGSDHNYRRCAAGEVQSELTVTKEYFEYFDDDNMFEGSKVVPVFLIY